MDKFDRSSNVGLKDEAASEVALSVERDFTNLIAIFDRQLDSIPLNDSVTRRHVTAARGAAERAFATGPEPALGAVSQRMMHAFLRSAFIPLNAGPAYRGITRSSHRAPLRHGHLRLASGFPPIDGILPSAGTSG